MISMSTILNACILTYIIRIVRLTNPVRVSSPGNGLCDLREYASVEFGEGEFVSLTTRMIYVSMCELSVEYMSCNACE